MLPETRGIWKYLETGTVKHLFFTEHSTETVCRIAVLDFIPNQWKNDEEGLRKKRPCKSCINIRDLRLTQGGQVIPGP